MHRANKHPKHVLLQFSNMAYIRNILWKEDDILKSDLKKNVKEDLRRTEILDFMKRDFSQYAWSLSSLDRRMRYFDIHYTDNNVLITGGPFHLISTPPCRRRHLFSNP